MLRALAGAASQREHARGLPSLCPSTQGGERPPAGCSGGCAPGDAGQKVRLHFLYMEVSNLDRDLVLEVFDLPLVLENTLAMCHLRCSPSCIVRVASGFLSAPLAPNAAAQARQTAGARYERTLFAVACSRLLGKGLGRDYAQEVVVLLSSATTRNTISSLDDLFCPISGSCQTWDSLPDFVHC